MPEMVSINKRRVVRFLIAGLLLSVLAVGVHAVRLLYTDNFHAVMSGEAFRAGQMSPEELAVCIRKYNIRGIVNLRGAHPERQWFRDEVATANKFDVRHQNLAISSGKPVGNKMPELVAILRRSPKPVLIHCDGGADRVALAAAIYLYAVGGQTPAVAEQEFSAWYGHLPVIWRKKEAMRRSFRQYVHEQEQTRSIAVGN